MNILALDDDPGILNVIKDNCELRDINCTVADNYDAAIELCKQVQFDIIIIDWFLREERNGIDFGRECRLLNKKSVILIVTAYDIPEETMKNSPWIDEWYNKPINIGEILTIYCNREAGLEVSKQELDELIENQVKIKGMREDFNEMISGQVQVCHEKFVHSPKLVSLISAVGALIVLLFTAVAAYWVNHDKLSNAITENRVNTQQIEQRINRLERNIDVKLERIEEKMDVLLKK